MNCEKCKNQGYINDDDLKPCDCIFGEIIKIRLERLEILKELCENIARKGNYTLYIHAIDDAKRIIKVCGEIETTRKLQETFAEKISPAA
jgi:hypothetical protein